MLNYKIIKNIEDLPSLNLDKEVIVFSDSESEKLYVGARLVQLYQPENELEFVFPNINPVYVLDLDYLDMEKTLEYLSNLHLAFYGASYDLGLLLFKPKQVDDLQYLCRMAYPNWKLMKVAKGEKPYALNVAVRRLKADYLYENYDKKELQKAGFINGAYLSKIQYEYSAMDTIALHYLWCDEKIQRARDIMAYKLDCKVLPYCVDLAKNKLLVDKKSVEAELIKANKTMKENLVLLKGLNPNSPKQCKEALKIDSTSKSEMTIFINENKDTEDKELANRVLLAKIIQQQRKLIKRIGMLESYNYDWVETRLNPAGALTGRFSSTGGDLERGINSQQITRDLKYIFHQDTEDTVVITADYSTAQLRIGASIMEDYTMRDEFIKGLDLHKKVVADLIFKIPYDTVVKEDRQKGKAVNFGFIFDMSGATFQEYAFVNYGVSFTLAESNAIKKAYKDKYKGIAKYHRYWWDAYSKEKGYVTIMNYSPLGRPNLAKIGNEAINYPTQAGEGECTKLAYHYMAIETKGESLKYGYNIVHDSIELRVPKGTENVWADILGRNMKLGWVELCKVRMMKFKDIPMPVEIEYNDYSSGVAVARTILM